MTATTSRRGWSAVPPLDHGVARDARSPALPSRTLANAAQLPPLLPPADTQLRSVGRQPNRERGRGRNSTRGHPSPRAGQARAEAELPHIDPRRGVLSTELGLPRVERIEGLREKPSRGRAQSARMGRPVRRSARSAHNFRPAPCARDLCAPNSGGALPSIRRSLVQTRRDLVRRVREGASARRRELRPAFPLRAGSPSSLLA